MFDLSRAISALMGGSSGPMDGCDSVEEILRQVQEAKEFLGDNIVYDSATFEEMDLQEIKEESYRANDKKLEDRSFEEILEAALEPLRYKGESKEKLGKSLKSVSNRFKVIDLLGTGQRRFMKREFEPNGGREFRFSSSYNQMRPICNNAVAELDELGRVLLFTENALAKAGVMPRLHVGTFVWTPKVNKKKGRTCLHASKGTKNFPSINASIDTARHDAFYEFYQLPFMSDIAEMACQQRDRYPGETLTGAIVDVNAAYQCHPQSHESAKLFAVKLKVPDVSRPQGWIFIIAICLVGVFGFTRGGNVYCLCATVIDEMHNRWRGADDDRLFSNERRSLTYVDDGILISPQRLISESVTDYVREIVRLFGQGGINYEKIKTWDHELDAIGWSFDFETWKVLPMRKGLAKMMLYLFHHIPVGATSAKRKDLEKLTGLLSWYADGIPAGKCYLKALFAAQSHHSTHSSWCNIQSARDDLTWWRALAIAVHHSPALLGCSLDIARRVKSPTRFLRTDASSTIGGGGCLSVIKGGVSLSLPGDAIRWTRSEMKVFESWGISINVLEYFTVVYYVMLWASELSGHVVHVECDNSAAVSWLVKKRGSGVKAADAITRIFSLFCHIEHVSLFTTHIAGVDNVIADFRSRDLEYYAQGEDERFEDMDCVDNCNRQGALRRLLHLCVTKPEEMHGPALVNLLTHLRTTPG